MQLANRHWESGDRYRFGFNGKEHDDEWNGEGNMLDFGARVYDPRLGRWLAIDPLSYSYPSLSSYCYVGNSPVLAIDPDGRQIKLVGSTDDINSFLEILSSRTGITWKTDENGVLTPETRLSKSNDKTVSLKFAQILLDAYDNPEKKTYILDRNVKIGGQEVEGDDYDTGIIDIADFESYGTVPAFQAAMIGHTVLEREKQEKYDKVRVTGKGYKKKPEAAILEAEIPILQEMTGKKIAFLRTVSGFENLGPVQREIGLIGADARYVEGRDDLMVGGYFYSDYGILIFKDIYTTAHIAVREAEIGEVRNLETGEKIYKVTLDGVKNEKK